MNTRGDITLIKAFLLRHGHTEQELENLERDEMINLYEKDTRTQTLNFLHFIDEDSYAVKSTLDEADIGDLKTQVRENADNTFMLIELIREGFNHFSYSDIADILTMNVKNISVHKLQRILRIAYREFQETLLDRIAKHLKGMPIEEYKTILNFYEKNRDDIARLKKTIAELTDETKRRQIVDMARLKLLVIKDFMPKNIFNETYKEYLNNIPEKLNLVAEIRQLTGMYSKNHLKNIPYEELEILKERILEDKRRDERDQKVYAQYIQMLEESMYGSDEQEFSSACIKIITTSNQAQLAMVMDYLSAKNPVFLNRFHSLLRDFKKNLKH
ncbi:hypothetical protein V3I05_08085 [Helicobacter mastomyrinus]|uniref:DUF3944 domain-containing protein n=1 Tax=Helicobacter mastomyrinus TaxID=287948 RepID=A0ABZ3F397_9HELI